MQDYRDMIEQEYVQRDRLCKGALPFDVTDGDVAALHAMGFDDAAIFRLIGIL